jgi:hypothetical protein
MPCLPCVIAAPKHHPWSWWTQATARHQRLEEAMRAGAAADKAGASEAKAAARQAKVGQGMRTPRKTISPLHDITGQPLPLVMVACRSTRFAPVIVGRRVYLCPLQRRMCLRRTSSRCPSGSCRRDSATRYKRTSGSHNEIAGQIAESSNSAWCVFKDLEKRRRVQQARKDKEALRAQVQ